MQNILKKFFLNQYFPKMKWLIGLKPIIAEYAVNIYSECAD